MNKKQILMERINKLINGLLTYQEFSECYYTYFLKNVTSKDLTKDENDFFSNIQEQFDWTVENPSNEDRSYGYMDWSEFIRYVRKILIIFLEQGKLDWQEAEKIKVEIVQKNKN